MESNQVKSVSIIVGPEDKRCRSWTKIIRAGHALPSPSNVADAGGIPTAYSRNGDEELFIGDILIKGEANHHVKNRGWSYIVKTVDDTGALVRYFPNSETKARMKEAGLPAELLPGSGDVAACVRIAHGIRLGLLTGETACVVLRVMRHLPVESSA